MAYMTDRRYGSGRGLGATPCRPGLGALTSRRSTKAATARRFAVVGPGWAVAPASAHPNVTDHAARRTSPGLGAAPLAIIGATAGGLFHSSTTTQVEATLARYAQNAAAGSQSDLDLLVLRSGVTGLPSGYAPQNAAREYARSLIGQLLAAGKILGPMPVPPQATAPTGVSYTIKVGASTAPVTVVGPGVAQSSSAIQDIVAGFLTTPVGQQLQTTAVKGAVQAKTQQVGDFVSRNLGTILLVSSAGLVLLNIASNRRGR